MTFKKRLLYTKGLVSISIFCSLITFIIGFYGLGEIYPFFSYKLYTQPLGSTHVSTEYRIYTRSSAASSFKRNPIKETRTFDFDSYAFTFNFLVSKSVEAGDQQEEYQKKLLIFAKHVVPGQAEYKIVSETYHPLDLLKKNTPYDTATVIAF